MEHARPAVPAELLADQRSPVEAARPVVVDGAVTRYAIDGFPSRPDAADLLVVPVERLGQARVHHGADVGHVYPESEGRRADHDVVPGRGSLPR